MMRNIKKKKVNMRYAHFMTWNMAKNIQNMENKNCTLKDLEYSEKH